MSFGKPKFHGEEIFDDCYAVYVWIRKPFFKAGKIYGWKGMGVGVNLDILDYAEKFNRKIRVVLKDYVDRVYEVEPSVWKKFSLEHNSIQKEKLDGKSLPDLYIIQLSQQYFKTVKMNCNWLRKIYLK
jgi:copper oxidase (laccase) domain-containing protein